MGKSKKQIKCSIIVFSIVILVSLLGSYTYFTKFVYFKVKKDERDKIVWSVKAAPPLPLRFYDIYNKVYSNTLNHGQLYYLFNRENNECPCRLASYDFSSAYKIHLVNFTFWLESQASQKECLTYYLANVDLLHNTKGVFQASEYYSNKSIDNLSDYELLKLIVIIENPSYYNADKLNEKVNNILNRINL